MTADSINPGRPAQETFVRMPIICFAGSNTNLSKAFLRNEPWVRVLALLLTSSVAWGKLFSHARLQFSHLCHRDPNTYHEGSCNTRKAPSPVGYRCWSTTTLLVHCSCFTSNYQIETFLFAAYHFIFKGQLSKGRMRYSCVLLHYNIGTQRAKGEEQPGPSVSAY